MRASLSYQNAFACCTWYIFLQEWVDFLKACYKNISGDSDETVLWELWGRWTPNIYKKIEKRTRVPGDSFYHNTKGCVWIQIINLFRANCTHIKSFVWPPFWIHRPNVRGLERKIFFVTWPIPWSRDQEQSLLKKWPREITRTRPFFFAVFAAWGFATRVRRFANRGRKYWEKKHSSKDVSRTRRTPEFSLARDDFSRPL